MADATSLATIKDLHNSYKSIGYYSLYTFFIVNNLHNPVRLIRFHLDSTRSSWPNTDWSPHLAQRGRAGTSKRVMLAAFSGRCRCSPTRAPSIRNLNVMTNRVCSRWARSLGLGLASISNCIHVLTQTEYSTFGSEQHELNDWPYIESFVANSGSTKHAQAMRETVVHVLTFSLQNFRNQIMISRRAVATLTSASGARVPSSCTFIYKKYLYRGGRVLRRNIRRLSCRSV